MPLSFQRSVFVNCPFDDQYRSLFRPLIFTVLYLGLAPRTAFERADSGEQRISKIVQLIKGSRYSIHDLSRCKASRRHELFRLNMPLELGIDYGCRQFCRGNRRRKKFLILETERYRFQQAVSDLSGCDIKAHNNRVELLIRVVRDWLVQEASVGAQPASKIKKAFMNFTADFYDDFKTRGYSVAEIDSLTMHEQQRAMRDWVRRNK